jgi:hypothetical protein
MGKIKIPDIVRTDLGDDWKSMRMTAASKFVTSNGIELDTMYGQLAEQFKDLFSGTSDPTAQFTEIVNNLKAYRSDVDRLEPIAPEKLVGFKEDVFESLIYNVSSMRQQIRDHLTRLKPISRLHF